MDVKDAFPLSTFIPTSNKKNDLELNCVFLWQFSLSFSHRKWKCLQYSRHFWQFFYGFCQEETPWARLLWWQTNHWAKKVAFDWTKLLWKICSIPQMSPTKTYLFFQLRTSVNIILGLLYPRNDFGDSKLKKMLTNSILGLVDFQTIPIGVNFEI